MKTIKFVTAAIALSLVLATAFAVADCCAGNECCRDGKGDCCKEMKGGDHGRPSHVGYVDEMIADGVLEKDPVYYAYPG